MTNRALLVVDMQNGFCHPDGSFPSIGLGLEGARQSQGVAVGFQPFRDRQHLRRGV